MYVYLYVISYYLIDIPMWVCVCELVNACGAMTIDTSFIIYMCVHV